MTDLDSSTVNVMASGQAYPATSAKSPSPIESALDDLSHELDMLQTAIINLQGTISPVLHSRDSEQSKPEPGPSAEPGMSSVLSRIVTSRDSVVMLRESVKRTTERVEL